MSPEYEADAPDWESGGRVHNWKNYVSEELRAMWSTFTVEQRGAIYRSAEESAGREEWE